MYLRSWIPSPESESTLVLLKRRGSLYKEQQLSLLCTWVTEVPLYLITAAGIENPCYCWLWDLKNINTVQPLTMHTLPFLSVIPLVQTGSAVVIFFSVTPSRAVGILLQEWAFAKVHCGTGAICISPGMCCATNSESSLRTGIGTFKRLLFLCWAGEHRSILNTQRDGRHHLIWFILHFYRRQAYLNNNLIQSTFGGWR